MLQRVHRLDHRAELGALGRALAGQALVAGEHARHLAVVAVEDLQHPGGEGPLDLPPGQTPGQGIGFQGHARVDDVLVESPQAATRRRAGHVLAAVEGHVVEALGVELAGQVEQPGLAGLLVGVVDRDQPFEPAELAPGEEGRPVERFERRLEVAHDRLEDGGVARRFVVLDEHLVRQQNGPEIVGLGAGVERIGGVPAVGPLVGDDLIDVSLDLGLEGLVVEDPGQRNDAVEPVGGPLPALGLAAEPLALADIGPELIEMTAQAVGLEAKLSLEPARRTDRAQRQGAEGRLGESGFEPAVS